MSAHVEVTETVEIAETAEMTEEVEVAKVAEGNEAAEAVAVAASSETFTTASCFLGGPQTGRTASLAALACKQLQKGACEVLILCANPEGVRAMTRQLHLLPAFAQVADDIRITDIQSIALEIMAEPTARELFGREPRLLEPFEERFLFEDLRTSSFKGRRLHAVLEFLECGWTRLADDDPNWLITLEEEAVAGLVRDNLRFTGGILPSELGNFAVRTLQSHAQVQARHGACCVLVDDYHLLDRASQMLARLLARDTFAFAADNLAPACDNAGRMRCSAISGYPFSAGIAEFLHDHPKTQVNRLVTSAQPKALQHALARINVVAGLESNNDADLTDNLGTTKTNTTKSSLDTEAAGSPSVTTPSATKSSLDENPCIQVCFGEGMGDELRTIAAECMRARNAGESVLIVSASSLWCRNAAKNLSAAGLQVVTPSSHIKVKDFRDERACARAYQRTLELLRRNPHDGVAWRSLIGFGDYVARSAALEDLRKAVYKCKGSIHIEEDVQKAARKHNDEIRIEEALQLLCDGTFEGIDPADPLYASLAEAYLRARKTVDALGATSAPTTAPDAQQSSVRARQSAVRKSTASADGTAARSTFPISTTSLGADEPFCICDINEAVWHQADTVIFGGFVNGIIPSRDKLEKVQQNLESGKRTQDPAWNRDLYNLHVAVGAARKRVLLTGFKSCSLETAERLGLHIGRIKLQNGARVCTVAPSAYLPLLAGE